MRICVYCSSSGAIPEHYNEAARELGRLIGERGHTLVYGGCTVGAMGELARAVHAAGGQVMGIVPRAFMERGIAYFQADELILTATMAERKAEMERLAEAFIVLPGGFGTLDELFQTLTLKQLGQVDGAVVLLNVAGFYDGLLAHLERLYSERLARAEHRTSYYVASSAREALDYAESNRETPLPPKWIQ